jgi:hypothetical protein
MKQTSEEKRSKHWQTKRTRRLPPPRQAQAWIVEIRSLAGSGALVRNAVIGAAAVMGLQTVEARKRVMSPTGFATFVVVGFARSVAWTMIQAKGAVTHTHDTNHSYT